MCRLLKVTRSLVYYHLNKEKSGALDEEDEIKSHIIDIFYKSKTTMVQEK